MKQKRHSTEEIIRILREVDNGRGMELQDARRYRELEKEPGVKDDASGQFAPQDPGAGGSERKKVVSPRQKRQAVAQTVSRATG